MYEQFWRLSFIVFAAALPLSAAHAIIRQARRKTGGAHDPAWLVWFRRLANLVIAAGFAALTATIIARWNEAGYPPFSNMPESLMWMAWGLCAVYFVARCFADFSGLEAGACVGVLAVLAVSGLFDHAPRPLMPALQSNWLIFHVLTCMISYGAFFAAFLMALLWLAFWRRRESGKVVDALSYHTMAFGFLLLTVGIISGSVWARQAWGRYWGWDPKETWSLITWFVYGIYLHYRLLGGSRGPRQERLPMLNALFAVLGFAVTLFTYFGVSYLLPSLHSYS
ncbi:MAG TPA: cytochrome c biogenesis protein CcsA [Planctomycetota bacterium]|nr:cytochrome c biogenesis protein CcsA [Planctomycetota bacterium]HRR83083.1 cytochrome c biogenesis protein CcsA [Planctomycetota bacterium]HRT96990.1 cytochrome c biogenesis protein CcsA [Planctomycetota bacterium]